MNERFSKSVSRGKDDRYWQRKRMAKAFMAAGHSRQMALKKAKSLVK
ncbi:hypothetical protein Q3V30_12930 [Erwinia pyri]|uniref:Uncharacterized protein n=1 Tax=Erwinia pyri TaxID=3062598 RepID=A0AA50DFS7_9GAMM|nr:hypothetical protein [Erwinia sp. DE2]WLS77389.1 hypothetical protein Q3V30_12930 [Erwinia sp. DE2]